MMMHVPMFGCSFPGTFSHATVDSVDAEVLSPAFVQAEMRKSAENKPSIGRTKLLWGEGTNENG